VSASVVDALTSEADLQAAIVDLARLHRWRVFHVFDARRSERGFPDLCLVRPPRLLFAELKRLGRDPTSAQQDWLDALAAAGAECHVWRPSDWPAIERTLT